MTVERWDAEKHLPMVHEWARLRGIGPDAGDVSLLPPTGFLADRIVVGFFYLTNSRLGFLGSIISDPKSTKEARGPAIRDLIEAATAFALEHGVRTVVSMPSVQSLTGHFGACGFELIENCHYAFRRIEPCRS